MAENVNSRIKWSREETILTLDFYYSHFPEVPPVTSPELEKLRQSLHKVWLKLNPDSSEQRRSIDSVHMKLGNFHSLNPNYLGKGLKKHSKLDEKVFQEFHGDIPKLREVSQKILQSLDE